MDKITNYQNILIDFLKEQAAPTLGMNPDIRREVKKATTFSYCT